MASPNAQRLSLIKYKFQSTRSTTKSNTTFTNNKHKYGTYDHALISAYRKLNTILIIR